MKRVLCGILAGVLLLSGMISCSSGHKAEVGGTGLICPIQIHLK